MRRTADAKGFTLIEVLVAMLVFSIGALGILGMVTTSLKLNTNARQIGEASRLGIFKLDQLQTSNPQSSDLTSCGTRCWSSGLGGRATTAATVRPSDLLSGGTGSNARFQLTWNSRMSGELRYIGVTVYWPKERDKIGLDVGDTGFIDCTVAANDHLCYRVQFHTYRRV